MIYYLFDLDDTLIIHPKVGQLNYNMIQPDNKLNTFNGGLMKYWVDSHDYGVVEIAHTAFLHSIL